MPNSPEVADPNRPDLYREDGEEPEPVEQPKLDVNVVGYPDRPVPPANEPVDPDDPRDPNAPTDQNWLDPDRVAEREAAEKGKSDRRRKD